MLQRRIASNGVVFYESPLLREIGVPHAFSTRLGGLSPAPFDSMNLGNPNGCAIQDDYERVWENYRILQRCIDCDGRTLARVHQVHGAGVAEDERGSNFDIHQQADAIVGNDPSKVLSVRVADCVPVLLASAEAGVVAAVHAGWRGVIANVLGAAIAKMRARGARDIRAAIGPAISFDAFEVGPEVAEQFASSFGPAVTRDAGGGKWRVDLIASVRRQLNDLTICEDHIDWTDRCTFTCRDEFFSHRRENGVTGRMAALISVP